MTHTLHPVIDLGGSIESQDVATPPCSFYFSESIADGVGVLVQSHRRQLYIAITDHIGIERGNKVICVVVPSANEPLLQIGV